MNESKWKIGYYIASYIIAIVAVIGFYLSIDSSNKLATTLDNIQARMMWLTDPLIKLKKITLLYAGKKVSCDNPPFGVLMEYENVSNVSIQVHNLVFKIYFGDKLLDAPPLTLGSVKTILAPKGIASYSSKSKEIYSKYFSIKQDPMSATHFKIIIKIEFSRIGDNKKFTYINESELRYDCRKPTWDLYPINEVCE